jgi:hypothetical protein
VIFRRTFPPFQSKTRHQPARKQKHQSEKGHKKREATIINNISHQIKNTHALNKARAHNNCVSARAVCMAEKKWKSQRVEQRPLMSWQMGKNCGSQPTRRHTLAIHTPAHTQQVNHFNYCGRPQMSAGERRTAILNKFRLAIFPAQSIIHNNVGCYNKERNYCSGKRRAFFMRALARSTKLIPFYERCAREQLFCSEAAAGRPSQHKYLILIGGFITSNF